MIKTSDIIDRLFYNQMGQILISALFGISLALIFNRVCKDNCTIYFAPRYDEINNKIFKLEDVCYKYNTVNVACNDKPLNPYEGYDKPTNQMVEKTFFDKLFA